MKIVGRACAKLAETIMANTRASAFLQNVFKKHYGKRDREREREGERFITAGPRIASSVTRTNLSMLHVDQNCTNSVNRGSLLLFSGNRVRLRVSSSFLREQRAALIARPRNRVKTDSHSTTARPVATTSLPVLDCLPHLDQLFSSPFPQFPSAFLSNIPLPWL